MTILMTPVPTSSYRAWEVIGGLQSLLVQSRTEQGLQSNKSLYHRLLYKKTDHFPYRIIHSTEPSDFAKIDTNSSGKGASNPPVKAGKKQSGSKKKGDKNSASNKLIKKKRVVVALAKSRDDILRDWDTLKTARSEFPDGMNDQWSPLEKWDEFYKVVMRVGHLEGLDRDEEVCSAIAASEGSGSDEEDEEDEECELIHESSQDTGSTPVHRTPIAPRPPVQLPPRQVAPAPVYQPLTYVEPPLEDKSHGLQSIVAWSFFCVALAVLTTTLSELTKTDVTLEALHQRTGRFLLSIACMTVFAGILPRHHPKRQWQSPKTSPVHSPNAAPAIPRPVAAPQQPARAAFSQVPVMPVVAPQPSSPSPTRRSKRGESASRATMIISAVPLSGGSSPLRDVEVTQPSPIQPQAAAPEPQQTLPSRDYNIQVHVVGRPNEVFPPNDAPFSIESQYFEGGKIYPKVMLKPSDPRLDPYFQGKKRKFEIQMQGRLVIPPEHLNEDGSIKGHICFAAGMATKMKVGLTLKTLWRFISAAFTKLTRGALITIGSECEGALPAFTSYAAHAMDALIESDSFDTAPELGVPMLPDNGDLNRMRTYEKKAKKTPFVNGKVYTCSFHSQYADFDKWAMVNVPGMSSMDLHRFWDDLPLRVGFYLLPEGMDMRTTCSSAIPLFQIDIHHRSLPTFRPWGASQTEEEM